MSSTERRLEIGKIIWEAIYKAADVDWSRRSPEIGKAEADLDEAMFQYVNEETSKANVRTAYQRWRDAHKTGGLFT